MYILLIYFLVCILLHHKIVIKKCLWNLFRLEIFHEPIASLSIIRGWSDAPVVHNKWISRAKNSLKRIKRPIRTRQSHEFIYLRWTCQRVCVLHFKLHIGVLTLIRNSIDCYSRVWLIRGGGLESKKSQIIYTIVPGAKHSKHLVDSKLQTFNCQSFIIFNITDNAHNMHMAYFYKHPTHRK